VHHASNMYAEVSALLACFFSSLFSVIGTRLTESTARNLESEDENENDPDKMEERKAATGQRASIIRCKRKARWISE
jgi:hypothetical protein